MAECPDGVVKISVDIFINTCDYKLMKHLTPKQQDTLISISHWGDCFYRSYNLPMDLYRDPTDSELDTFWQAKAAQLRQTRDNLLAVVELCDYAQAVLLAQKARSLQEALEPVDRSVGRVCLTDDAKKLAQQLLEKKQQKFSGAK